MEFKVYRPKKVELPETGLGTLARNVVSSGAKSVSDVVNLGKIPDTLVKHGNQVYDQQLQNDLQNAQQKGDTQKVEQLQSYMQQRERTAPKGIISQGIEKGHESVKSLLPEKYLEPQNEFEETAQDYASMLPLYFLSGGYKGVKDVIKFFGKVAGGRYAGKKLEEAGFGPLSHVVGQIGVPAFFEYINLNNLKEHFSPKKEDLYNGLPEIAGETKQVASTLEDALEKANKDARGRLHKKEIYENLNDIKDMIHDGHLEVKDLQPLKAKLNKSVHTDNLDTLKPVLNEVKTLINKHPEYGEAVSKADKLHKNLLDLDMHIDDAKNFISNAIKNLPLKKSAAVKKGATLLIENPIRSGTGLAWDLTWALPEEAAEYAIKALRAATKKNSGALLSSLNKLGQMVEEAENQEPITFKVYRPTKV